jgi:hypothetical protein
MSSTERLALKGKLVELREKETKLRLKISGNVKLLKSYFYEVEYEDIDNFEEKSIAVFSGELTENIVEMKSIRKKINDIENKLE